jgi:ABC-2 type transport system permease protein
VVFGDQFDSGPGPAAGPDQVTAARFFLPGMVAAGVMLTSFQTIALSVAVERDDGTLKRLRCTPMPPVAYFLGKVGLVASTSLAQLALLLLVARVAFDVPLPTDAGRWLTLTWVLLLGTAVGTVVGVAYSSLASTARSASAIVVGPALVLQFISGVYFAYDSLPTWIQQVASAFPLKWIAQGMRSVFLPGSWEGREPGGGWEHGLTALVLAAWFVLALALCVRTFRWTRRGST